MRRLCAVFAALLLVFPLFGTCAGAEELSPPITESDVPNSAMEYLPNELFEADADSFLELFTAENVCKTVLDILKSVFPEAMEAFLALLGLLIISAVMAALRESVASHGFGAFLEYVSVLCTASAAFVFMEALFAEFEAFIEQINAFMLAVIPAMSALMLSSGEVSSSLVFGGVLSGVVALLEFLCTSAVIPMLKALLCVYISAKICGVGDLSAFAGLLKNVVTYTLTTITVIMTCVLTFQSVIAKSADTAAVKGVKFVLGNTVPIVGGALADAVGTVASSLGMLKSTTGIISAVVLCVIFAVPVLKLLVWKTVFDAIGAVGAALSLKKESEFFANMGEIIAFLAALMASVAVFFIIALTAAALGR